MANTFTARPAHFGFTGCCASHAYELVFADLVERMDGDTAAGLHDYEYVLANYPRPYESGIAICYYSDIISLLKEAGYQNASNWEVEHLSNVYNNFLKCAMRDIIRQIKAAA